MKFERRAIEYSKFRKPDIRMTNKVIELLDLESKAKIADIGAGTGNYTVELKRAGYEIFAVEPEDAMRSQCLDKEINWIDSYAEEINLPTQILDGAVMINSIHHFYDIEKALKEINRILKSGPLLIFTFDPNVAKQIWIFDYWPALREYEDKNYLNMEQLKRIISSIFSSRVDEFIFEIPYDFRDCFSAATWKTPEVLLNKDMRTAMSLFNCVDNSYIDEGVKKLRNDILSGQWEQKYATIVSKSSLDVGARFLRAMKK